MTYMTIWHYFIIFIMFLILVGGIYISIKQEKKKLIAPMLFSVVLVVLTMTFLAMFVVDKYTKKVELYRVKNKRLLSIEKIIYTGIVKNTGNYTIGEVTFDIKLVSRGKTGGIKATTFYKSSGFLDFFSESNKINKGSNTLEKSFVTAKNLKSGHVKSFRVYFKFPPNFRNISQYTKVYGH